MRELGDMREKFTQRGIDYPKLKELYDACNSYQPDPNHPEGLKHHLLQTVGQDSNDAVAGGRMYYKRTSEDAYTIERLDDFWDKLLCSSPHDWVGRLCPWAISGDFHNGYYTYTKWNPVAYPANWRALSSPYPDHCLEKHANAIDRMFEDEGLIQTYGKVMKLLPEYIDIACFLYRTYRDVILEFVAKKNQKIMEEPERKYNACKALFLSLDVNYITIQDFLEAHTEFRVIVKQLGTIRDRLANLHNKIISELSAQ